MVKKTWWQYYDVLPEALEQFTLSLDATFKGAADSDFVVLQAWAKRGANYYLLDQDRGRWNFPDTQRHFLAMCGKWPQANTKLIEAKANGQAIIDSLRDKVAGMIAINPHESKQARVAAVSPLIEAGNVYLPAAAPWVDDYVEEFAAFPNGRNDDMVDSTSQALSRMSRKKWSFTPVITRPR